MLAVYILRVRVSLATVIMSSSWLRDSSDGFVAVPVPNVAEDEPDKTSFIYQHTAIQIGTEILSKGIRDSRVLYEHGEY
jgi:hypothetical protein